MNYIFKYLSKYKIQSIIAPLFKLIEALLELTIPMFVAQLIDSGILQKNTDIIIKTVAYMLIIGIVGFSFSIIAQKAAANVAVDVAYDLRKRFYKTISRMDYSTLEKQNSDKLFIIMNNDVTQISTGINFMLRLVLRSPFIVFGAFFFALLLNRSLSIIFLITIIILFFIVGIIQFISVKKYHSLQSNLEEISRSTMESFEGSKVIRAFNQEENEINTFNRLVDNNTWIRRQIANLEAFLVPITFLVVNGATVLLLYFGGIKSLSGQMRTGDLFALVNYMASILVELVKSVGFTMKVNRACISANRLENTIRENTYSLDDNIREENINLDNDIVLKLNDISFAYSDEAENAISDITFTAKKGEKIGILGAMASGKSTLAQIIVGDYRNYKGSAELYGKSYKSLKYSTIRELVGFVPQQEFFIKDSLRKNLVMGKHYADEDERLKNACKLSAGIDIVNNKGLDAEIELGGANLSRGQRQRLMLARALYRQSKILVLDDCLTAIDNENQRIILDNLENMEFDLLVIISQRPNIVKDCDKIILMDNGKLSNIGNHKELLDKSALYREMQL